MQEVKDIFVANAALDNLCTGLFGVEVVFIVLALASKGQLPLFCTLLVLADALVSRVKLVGAAAGTWLSNAVHRAGMVDVAPLSGPIQLKKWTEQSWQLFLHVAFAALEWRILAQEPWHADPATCWSPHPYEQARVGHRSDLTLLYLAQLAVWVYTCVVHRFFDERRKDYFVLYVHHIVTIMLVGACACDAEVGDRRSVAGPLPPILSFCSHQVTPPSTRTHMHALTFTPRLAPNPAATHALCSWLVYGRLPAHRPARALGARRL